MKDVLLIKPPYAVAIPQSGTPPLSLAYLAGSLRERHSVAILDLQFFPYEDGEWVVRLRESVACHQPSVIGLTCLYSGDIQPILALAGMVKKEHPEIHVVLGGLHPTIFGKEILRYSPNVDFIVKGEGEESMTMLVDAIKSGAGQFSHIDGLVWRDERREIHEQEKTRFIEDLDMLPSAAYDLFLMNDYKSFGHLPNPKRHAIRLNFPVITSRSCGRSCNFCSLHHTMGYKLRMRSAEKVLDELEHLYTTFGITYFDIEDDSFTLSKPRVLEICCGIGKRNLDVQFRLRNGVYIPSLDDELIAALAEAGLVFISLPIESGSDYIRNAVIGKNVSRAKIDEVCHLFSRYEHIHTNAFFIIGMPEETPETLNESLALIDQVPLHSFTVMPATPYPGTRLYDQCVRDNLLTEKFKNRETLWLHSLEIGSKISRDTFLIQPYAMTIPELVDFGTRFQEHPITMAYRKLWNKRQVDIRVMLAAILARNDAGAAWFIFGGGYYGRECKDLLDKLGISITGFLDNNPALWRTTISDVPVNPPGHLKEYAFPVVLIGVRDKMVTEAICRQLNQLGVENVIALSRYAT